MRQFLFRGAVLFLVLCLLSGCTTQQTPENVSEETTAAATEAPVEVWTESTAAPEHSDLYIPGVSAEDVILYFNEVCLDAEVINYGDPAKLQRWETPIRYICLGAYTDTDKNTLDTLVNWLNTVDGFPGIQETQEDALANLRIHFCTQAEHLALMGEGFSNTDGAVTFWYNEADEIYDAVISCRADVDQELRNSVILEELYNGLGPINDTSLRADSIIYSEFSTPQDLSLLDALILKLLYHPQMQCGMDAAACEAIIRQLYY